MKKTIKISFLGLISTGIIFVACTKPTKFQTSKGIEASETVNSINARTNNVFTGEEIFEGIFFFKGDFVSLAPLLSNVSSNLPQSPDYISKRDALLDFTKSSLKSRNPNYFLDFKTKIKGLSINQYAEFFNEVKLDIVLVLLSKSEILEQFATVYNLSKTELQTISNTQDRVKLKTILTTVTNFNVNTFLNGPTIFAVVLPNVIVYSAPWIFISALVIPDEHATLGQESLIADIFRTISNIN